MIPELMAASSTSGACQTFIPLLGIIRMPCYTPHAYDKIKLMGGET